jgi:transketolase
MDAVQKANSGFMPRATPMALAPAAVPALDAAPAAQPARPAWIDRDRFILSAGHASMLLYSLLHLTGYDLSLDDIRNFRQWESRTPGHPEYGMTPGVETTTGPLGQGFANGVGMAMAEAHLAARVNRPGHAVIDHHVYAICSDGDLMEGVAARRPRSPGTWLGKLIYFWDDNSITIEGDTDLAFTEDVLEALRRLRVAHAAGGGRQRSGRPRRGDPRGQADPRPSMISVRTVIGYGSPNKAGARRRTASRWARTRSSRTKENLGWPATEPSTSRTRCASTCAGSRRAGRGDAGEWQERFRASPASTPTPPRPGRRAVAAPPRRLGRRPAHLGSRRQADRHARGLGQGAQRDRGAGAVADRRLGGPGGIQQHRHRGESSFLAGLVRGAQPALRRPRARHGLADERDGAARRRAAVRRHLPDLLRLHAPAHPARRADGAAGDLHLHARQRRSGRGRPRRTSRGAARGAARHPRPGGPAPRRRRETVEAWRFAMEYRGGPSSWRSPARRCRTWTAALAAADGLRRGAYVLADAEGGAPDVDADRQRLRGRRGAGGARPLQGEGSDTRGQHAELGALRRGSRASTATRCCRPRLPRASPSRPRAPWDGTAGSAIAARWWRSATSASPPPRRRSSSTWASRPRTSRPRRAWCSGWTAATRAMEAGEAAAGPAAFGVDERATDRSAPATANENNAQHARREGRHPTPTAARSGSCTGWGRASGWTTSAAASWTTASWRR